MVRIRIDFRHRFAAVAALVFAASCPTPTLAQDTGEAGGPPVTLEDSVFSGDFLSVGVGAAINPSYTGSDDYVITVLPIVQGSLGGVSISPRAGGVTLDFIQAPEEGPDLNLGLSARVRGNRASQIEDDIVLLYGELDRAVEIGPSIGVTIPQVLHPFDSVTFTTDVMFDMAGAHGGTIVSPSVSYSSPLSRAVFANLSISAEWGDEDFQDYNFAVRDADYTGSGTAPLAEFDPDGGGFTSAGITLLLGIDLDGDITNGGLGLVVIGGYSRVLGDAAATPFTRVRGTRNQFLGAVGLGYTF